MAGGWYGFALWATALDPEMLRILLASSKARRHWRGRTRRHVADEYEAYNYEVGIKPLIEKAMGVQTLRDDRADEPEFITISYCESVEAMSRFTGGDPTRIHHVDRDPAFLIELPSGVQILRILAFPTETPVPTGRPEYAVATACGSQSGQSQRRRPVLVGCFVYAKQIGWRQVVGAMAMLSAAALGADASSAVGDHSLMPPLWDSPSDSLSDTRPAVSLRPTA